MKEPNVELGYKLAKDIYETSVRLSKIKLKIQAAKSAIINKVLNTSSLWVNSRPPSMSLMEKTYLVDGIDGIDLKKMYEEKEDLQAELDYKKLLLEIFKMEVEVWRTQSANKRILS